MKGTSLHVHCGLIRPIVWRRQTANSAEEIDCRPHDAGVREGEYSGERPQCQRQLPSKVRPDLTRLAAASSVAWRGRSIEGIETCVVGVIGLAVAPKPAGRKCCSSERQNAFGIERASTTTGWRATEGHRVGTIDKARRRLWIASAASSRSRRSNIRSKSPLQASFKSLAPRQL